MTESPLILQKGEGFLRHATPHSMAYFGGIFWLMWGRVVEILFRNESKSKNRKWERQTWGVAIVPLSTRGTRYGNSVSTAWMPPRLD